MQAAFGLVQMKKLPDFTKKRRSLVERYLQNLANTPYILPIDDGTFNWLAMPMLVPPHWDRKALLNYIECNGIQTRVFFAGNVTRHPAYREFYSPDDPYPNSDTIMRDCFMLGAHHGLDLEDVDYVCDVLKKFDPDAEAAKSTLDPGACDL
jgi:CDP-6-deoxy-D-xylo-4-hexulose-3-dehydrase